MSRAKRSYIKAKIVLRDNRVPILFLMIWFVFGFCVYRFAEGLSVRHALLACVFFEWSECRFTSCYEVWTSGVIFGIAFSVLFQNILQKYNPERSCRMFAKELRDHIVVIGHSHLGRRLVAHFREHGISYCIIEKDPAKVDDLLREGEPVIIDDGRQMDALEDSRVALAKAVLVASNNLETALLVTKRARQLNSKALIITRCYQDEFAEIIETLGANEIISSSKNAFDDILARMENLA